MWVIAWSFNSKLVDLTDLHPDRRKPQTIWADVCPDQAGDVNGADFTRDAVARFTGPQHLQEFPCAVLGVGARGARDSVAFSSIFLASSFFCSQTESTPAPAPVT
jgi:hypothetical protein